MITVCPFLKESSLPWEQIYRKFAATIEDKDNEVLSLIVGGCFQEVLDLKTLGKEIEPFNKIYKKHEVKILRMNSSYEGYDLGVNIATAKTPIDAMWVSILSKGIVIRCMDTIGHQQAVYLPKDFRIKSWKRTVIEGSDFQKSSFQIMIQFSDPSKVAVDTSMAPIPLLDKLELTIG